MNDRAAVHAHPPLRLELELYLDEEPVSGSLRTGRGPHEEFVGWLGFIEALRRLSDAHPTERS